MSARQSLIAELEQAMKAGSNDKRVDTLRRVTDLFVADADRLSNQQIDVFDSVLCQLIKRIEGLALAELSQRLGPVNNAPNEVINKLARDDDIAVAGPILTQSKRLHDRDLVDIANTKGQSHLLAIAARSEIVPSVTDALLKRGDREVFHKLAENSGAGFSESGFAALVRRSERDGNLAEKVGLRLDVPLKLFRELLAHATEAVRSRLLAVASPESRDKIQRILADISEETQHQAGFQRERDYSEAHGRILTMKASGELTEGALFQFVKEDRYADVIAGLSALCGAPMSLVENLLQSNHCEAWLIPCRVSGLDWPTVRAIITCRALGRLMSDQSLDIAKNDYLKLSQATAARVLRFWQVRHTTTGSASSAVSFQQSRTSVSNNRLHPGLMPRKI